MVELISVVSRDRACPAIGATQRRTRSRNIGKASYRPAHGNRARLHDPRRHAAVATHSVVPTRPEDLLHAGARVACACYLDHSIAHPQPLPRQPKQVQARHNHVAAQLRGCHVSEAEIGGNGTEMLVLDQRDLPQPSSAPLVMIANDARFGIEYRRHHGNNRRSPTGPQADPFDCSRTDRRSEQRSQWRGRVQHAPSLPPP